MIFKSKLNLNEEMTISNNVVEVTKIIRDECLIQLENASLKSSNEFNRFFKKAEFDVSTNNLIPNAINLHIDLFCYCFRDYNEYIGQKNTLNTNCLADFEAKRIELRLVTINGVPNNEFDSSIQHEVNHIFQYSNGAAKNENLYKHIVDVTNNDKSSYQDKLIAYILYLTFRTEQDSFVNQYYAYLKQNNIDWDFVYDYFPDDEENPYSKFLDVYYIISTMHISNEYMINTFGITKKQFFARIDKADKRMRNKMMKAASKYRNDITPPNAKIENTNRLSFMVESISKGIHYGETEF